MKIGILFLKGLFLGISMLLPGISGGTMAFILGIYEKIIDELAKLNSQQARYFLNLFTFKRKKFLKNISLLIRPYNWSFLLPLLIGSLFAVFLFTFIAAPFLEKYSLEFYSFIVGLILISLYLPFKKIKKTKPIFLILILSFFVNVALFYFFMESSFFMNQEKHALFWFLPAGFLVATALIIPGISGSYFLIIFGLYFKSLEAIRHGNFTIILLLLLGVFLGLIVMVKFVKVFLTHYWHEFLACILGFILGSLYSLCFIQKVFDSSLDNFSFLIYMIIPFLFFPMASRFFPNLFKS